MLPAHRMVFAIERSRPHWGPGKNIGRLWRAASGSAFAVQSRSMLRVLRLLVRRPMKIVLSRKDSTQATARFRIPSCRMAPQCPCPFPRAAVRRGFKTFDGATARSEPSLKI